MELVQTANSEAILVSTSLSQNGNLYIGARPTLDTMLQEYVSNPANASTPLTRLVQQTANSDIDINSSIATIVNDIKNCTWPRSTNGQRFMQGFNRAVSTPTVETRHLRRKAEDISLALSRQLLFYTYGPMALFVIGGVWLMFAAHWITWPSALLITVSVIVLLYALIVSYRVTLERQLVGELDIIESHLGTSQRQINDAVTAIPTGIVSGLYAMNGQTFQCPNF